MESNEFASSVERIFQAHIDGQREAHRTVENLAALLSKAPEYHHWLSENLWTRFLYFLSKPRVKLTSGRVLEPNVIDVALTAIVRIGDGERRLLLLFAYVDLDDPMIRENWISQVLPTLLWIVGGFHRDFSSRFLASIKANCEAYIDVRQRQLLGVDSPDQRFTHMLKQIIGAIDEIEFARFENELTPPRKTPELSPLQPKDADLTIQTQQPLVPTVVQTALEMADQRLREAGALNPKIAADLLRTSIDEAHRAIVSAISSPALPYLGGEKDGARRQFMRERGFITNSEEVFFSAIYSLISNEGSHKLVAPRETMLVMYQAVADYIYLLFRRLTTWKASDGTAKAALP